MMFAQNDSHSIYPVLKYLLFSDFDSSIYQLPVWKPQS